MTELNIRPESCELISELIHDRLSDVESMIKFHGDRMTVASAMGKMSASDSEHRLYIKFVSRKEKLENILTELEMCGCV